MKGQNVYNISCGKHINKYNNLTRIDMICNEHTNINNVQSTTSKVDVNFGIFVSISVIVYDFILDNCLLSRQPKR